MLLRFNHGDQHGRYTQDCGGAFALHGFQNSSRIKEFDDQQFAAELDRAEQLAKLYELRSRRDRVRVDAALAELSRAAAARGCAGTSGLGNNLMAPGPPHSLLGRDR